MILPSAVALEFELSRLVATTLRELGLPTESKANKHYLLTVFIPLVCKLHKIQTLDEKIVRLVIDLWKHRNSMAHEGFLKEPLVRSTAAELLAAAMFCLNYFIFFRGQAKARASLDSKT